MKLYLFITFFSLYSCNSYEVIKTHTSNYESKEQINRRKGITKVHYLKKTNNGVIIEKGMTIENNHSTMSDIEFEKIKYYDSIKGTLYKVIKVWHPSNRKK